MSTVGEKIRALRQERGMTQEDFAKFFNISRNYVSQIEANGRVPSFKLLERIALEFKVSVSKLIDNERAAFDIRASIEKEALIDHIKALQETIDEIKSKIQ